MTSAAERKTKIASIPQRERCAWCAGSGDEVILRRGEPNEIIPCPSCKGSGRRRWDEAPRDGESRKEWLARLIREGCPVEEWNRFADSAPISRKAE